MTMIARKTTILDIRMFTDEHAVEVTSFVRGTPVTVTLYLSVQDADALREVCTSAPDAFMRTVAARLNDNDPV